MEALPEWVYVKNDEVADAAIGVSVNQKGILNVSDQQGNVVFTATSHYLRKVMVAGMPTYEASLTFASPKDECLFGLG